MTGRPDDSMPPYSPEPPSQAPGERERWYRRHPKTAVALGVFAAFIALGGILDATGHDPSTPVSSSGPASVPPSSASPSASPPSASPSTAATAPATRMAKAAKTPAAAASSTAPATPSCEAQASGWVDGGAKQQLGALEDDLDAFSSDAQQFADDMGNGDPTSGDMSAVRSDAASMQSGAQAVESNPAPACLPGLRSDLITASGDYSKTGVEAQDAMAEYSDGSDGVATGDAEAAAKWMNQGNAMVSAASAAIAKLVG